LAPILNDYMRRFPEVRVEVFCTGRTVDLIEERFDVAIRAGALGDSSLIARSLGKVRWFLVGARRTSRSTGAAIDRRPEAARLHHVRHDAQRCGVAPPERRQDRARRAARALDVTTSISCAVLPPLWEAQRRTAGRRAEHDAVVPLQVVDRSRAPVLLEVRRRPDRNHLTLPRLRAISEESPSAPARIATSNRSSIRSTVRPVQKTSTLTSGSASCSRSGSRQKKRRSSSGHA